MVENKIYVLSGEDSLSKRYFIQEKVKKKYLQNDASSYKFFFSDDLDSKQLEEELRVVSMFTKVLVIHAAEGLCQECKDVFKKLLKTIDSAIVVFDYETPYEEIKDDDFFSFLSRLPFTSVHKTKTSQRDDFRDLLNALDRKNSSRALSVLNNLIFHDVSLRDFSTRLVGSLTGYYARRHRKMPPALLEFEKKLKRGIISKDILEVFVVKLCSNP